MQALEVGLKYKKTQKLKQSFRDPGNNSVTNTGKAEDKTQESLQ